MDKQWKDYKEQLIADAEQKIQKDVKAVGSVLDYKEEDCETFNKEFEKRIQKEIEAGKTGADTGEILAMIIDIADSPKQAILESLAYFLHHTKKEGDVIDELKKELGL